MIYPDDNIHDALEKVAGREADLYRTLKPLFLARKNARSPKELRTATEALGSAIKKHGLPKSLGRDSGYSFPHRTDRYPKALRRLQGMPRARGRLTEKDLWQRSQEDLWKRFRS